MRGIVLQPFDRRAWKTRYTARVDPAPAIGASLRRKEDRRLLEGAGRFVDDLRRDRLLHLGVVRSAEAHARVVAVGIADVRGLPGVVAAWTAADLPEIARPLVSGRGGVHEARPFDQPILAGDVVRHVGEPIAVVVAADAYQLADALAAAVVTYEPLPALPSVETALASPTRLHGGWPDNAALDVRATVGDVERAVARTPTVVAARLRFPRLSAMPIETRGALAERDPGSGRLVLWASIQNPYSVRDAVAAVLGLPAEEVRVMVPDVGGGFGPKGSVHAEEILVAVAAQRLGCAVKWVETRREHLVATGHDREQVHEARLGLAEDGTIVALDDRFLADVGAYPAEGAGLVANTVNHLPGPYRVPHYRAAGTSVVTTKTRNAAYRGSGRPEAVLVMERLLDAGARRLGLDPAEIRRRNLVRPEEMPYRPGLVYKDGVPVAYDPADFPAAFERALALGDYEGWRRRQRAERARGRRLGVGLACYVQGTGLGPFEGATVRVDPSGTVFVTIGVTSQGQSHATTLAQVAAAEIGVAWESVVVVAGDTTAFPFGMGTGGSRVAANAGPAVAQTAREVRRKAERVAAELLECAAEDVRIAGGRVHVAGVPGRFVTLGRVAQAAVRSRAMRAAGAPGLNACTWFYPETVTWGFGAHVAVVEVDTETGAVRLLAYAAVHDPGRAINPVIVEGQLHGGAVQGLAAALWEELVYDASGQLVTGSLMDYAIPRARDLPSLAIALVAHPSARNALGIKGAGESGAIGGAAAVANAVEDAVADLARGPARLGVTLDTLPVTPARLFQRLTERP